MLAAASLAAAWDLQDVSSVTLVVYTTPALRDLLEKEVGPAFRDATGTTVAFVYVPAGQQYNRLRLSAGHAEADLLVHSSPLYLVKGEHDGLLRPMDLGPLARPPPYTPGPPTSNDTASSIGPAAGQGVSWTAFAWSPLVTVYRPGLGAQPDLAMSDLPFGFAHPLLSNNGVYTVLLFENTSPEAGQRALQNTRVQPVNARANIGGVADGSFDVTVGYEAVTLFYQDQGAGVVFDLPLLDGHRYLAPVLFSAGIVRGDEHPQAEAFLRFLLSDRVQGSLAGYHFRSVDPEVPMAPRGLSLEGAERLDFDWSRAEIIESRLPDYMVVG